MENNFDNNLNNKPNIPNTTASTSLVFGIISLASIFACGASIMSFILGAVGITFALLSRQGKHFEKNARNGLILSVCACVITFVLTAIMIYVLVTSGALERAVEAISALDFNSQNITSDYYSIIEEIYSEIS